MSIDFNKKIGYIREKTSKKGTPFLKGKVGDQYIICFKSKNAGEDPRFPDWNVYESDPPEKKN